MYVDGDRPWYRSWPEGVPHHLDYPEIPLFAFLRDAARQYPRDIAFSCDQVNLTYGALDDLTDRLANGLHRLGMKGGDRVVLCLPNCPGIYFLANRRAITRYHLIYPGMLTREDEREIAREMERRKVPLAVFNVAPDEVAAYAPLLIGYLRATYRPVASHGMFTVWERREAHFGE